MIKAFAPAKINLTLHVTGQRDDGYHLLDSLVVFVDAGDRLTIEPADQLSLEVKGPHAKGVPVDESNLILKAAKLMNPFEGAKISLEKNLPVASGIGGGSTDAAAALRGLAELWGQGLPSGTKSLGADVPVCLHAKPTRMSGIGEVLAPVEELPECWLVLVNPGVEVSTPEVFSKLRNRQNPPMPEAIPSFEDVVDFASWLGLMRNDLEPAAMQIEPVIATVLASVRAQAGCLLGRMCGSGATCWGLFEDAEQAQHAADTIKSQRPDWWVQPTAVTPLS